jgi:hypothetical protein
MKNKQKLRNTQASLRARRKYKAEQARRERKAAREYEEALAILQRGDKAASQAEDFADALKDIYTKDKIESLTYANNPLLALLPKMKKW